MVYMRNIITILSPQTTVTNIQTIFLWTYKQPREEKKELLQVLLKIAQNQTYCIWSTEHNFWKFRSATIHKQGEIWLVCSTMLTSNIQQLWQFLIKVLLSWEVLFIFSLSHFVHFNHSHCTCRPGIFHRSACFGLILLYPVTHFPF